MIVVDIGNTNISIAQITGKNISKPFHLDSKKATKTTIRKTLQKLPKGPIIICSVVPKINKFFKNIGRKVFIVGKNIYTPIKSLYNKKQIGPDRLIAAYSAKKLHLKTRIVIDFGTAITVDFISSKGVYEGGIILPGLGSTLTVLSACAMLPKKVNLKSTSQSIPKNTSCSIAKGVEVGFSNMLNGLIADYKKKLKLSSSDQIVITGGEASVVRSKLNFRFFYEPNLVLHGLAMLNQNILTKE